MKKAFLTFLVLGLAGCTSQPVQITNTNQSQINAQVAVTGSNANAPAVSSSHSSEQQPPQSPHALPPGSVSTNPPPTGNNSGDGRNPMERAVDTSAMDAAIEKATKEFKQKPNDAAAKAVLAEAYFVRATALTEAAQYRSALGDYRRGLKLDPTNTEAQGMQDQIINIFQSLNREPPKEGAEPTPLPFKKA